MTAAQYDFTKVNNHQMEQGATTVWTFIYYTDVARTVKKDLTGYTARMQVRDDHDSDTVILEVTSTPVDGKSIVLGDAAGTILVTVPAEVTALLPSPFLGVYDLELIKDGIVERFLEGSIEITPEVTR